MHAVHTGRVVPEGGDPHSNIVTAWDGTWRGWGGCLLDVVKINMRLSKEFDLIW